MQRDSYAGFADCVSERIAFGLTVAIRQPEPVGISFRVAQPPAVAFSGSDPDTSSIAVGSFAITHTDMTGVENMSESPFLDSVERRRPGTSMRAYVTRTLPHSSAIVVANRAPHEPRPEGGFTRGAGGVITALLTMAEVTGADLARHERDNFSGRGRPLL